MEKPKFLSFFTNSKLSKKISSIIIILILLVSTAIFITFVIYKSYESAASKLFLDVYDKINEFNQPNKDKFALEPGIANRLDKIVKSYSRTKTAKRALFYKGYILYNTGDYLKHMFDEGISTDEKGNSIETQYKQFFNDAINTLNEFVNRNSKHPLVSKAYNLLSYCQYKLGDITKAIDALLVFNKKYYDSYTTPLAFSRLGFLYSKNNDKANAIKYYQKIVDEFPDSSFKDSAWKKLNIIKNDIVF